MQEVLRENLKIGELYYIECLTEDENNKVIVNHLKYNLRYILSFIMLRIMKLHTVSKWSP